MYGKYRYVKISLNIRLEIWDGVKMEVQYTRMADPWYLWEKTKKKKTLQITINIYTIL